MASFSNGPGAVLLVRNCAYVETVLHHSGPDLGSLGVKGNGQGPGRIG
jgi:hypothetical protein